MRATEQIVTVLHHIGDLQSATEVVDLAFAGDLAPAAWMADRPRLNRFIAQIMELDQPERRALAEAVAHDVMFHQHADQATFQFEFWKLAQRVRDKAHPFLVEFYSILMD